MSDFGNFKSTALGEWESRIDSRCEFIALNKKHDAAMLIEECESPIEASLLIEIFMDLCMTPMWYTFRSDREIKPDSGALYLIPQLRVDPYRIDIALYHKHFDGRELALAIECDGHDFHEKTKEQAARDKRRDRYLSSLGWTTLRFTGSEIHNNVSECALEILRVFANHMDGRTVDYGAKS
ncbi:MAG: DUF559 domain-containing protein [Pseudomonadota bacterium]